MSIDYLVLGALTRDLAAHGGWRAGGSSWYAAQAVARWGGRAAIVSPLMSSHVVGLDPAIQLLRVPSPHTATFRNSYQGDERTQYISAVPVVLDWAAIPPVWRTAPLVHLAPLAHELVAIPPRSVFPQAFIGLTAQGWLRQWDATGRISPRRWNPTSFELTQLDALVVSEEDVGGDEMLVQTWADAGLIVALTRGSRGATVWHNRQRYDVPAVPTTVVDPTGAGDTWAAAFFWQLQRGTAVEIAAVWACEEAARTIS